ncbi:TPA: hypothetical protein N0F65_009791 [Lagenidium giganteum]|uniref:CBM1 domain-containing protein n=1 Tax=Lagenidium giganteum TaxID=4803 RepID=A0AAV2YW96_9STRA|nr:TPA: hypothetical protein N0F65_009791 [Lagenidium giganteum]
MLVRYLCALLCAPMCFGQDFIPQLAKTSTKYELDQAASEQANELTNQPTVTTMLMLIPTIALAAATTAAADCSTPAYGACGDDNGIHCCPDNYYCQPWSSNYYQCMPAPSKRPKQITGVSLDGATSRYCTACSQQTAATSAPRRTAARPTLASPRAT